MRRAGGIRQRLEAVERLLVAQTEPVAARQYAADQRALHDHGIAELRAILGEVPRPPPLDPAVLEREREYRRAHGIVLPDRDAITAQLEKLIGAKNAAG